MARAQAAELRAAVPFDFRVGDVLMHAGEYEIQNDQGLLKLRNQTGPGGAFRLTFPATRPKATAEGKLVFKRYNGEYHLTSLWSPASTEGRILIPTKHEKELEAQNKAVQTAQVPTVLTSSR
jgi:hypothetical protein